MPKKWALAMCLSVCMLGLFVQPASAATKSVSQVAQELHAVHDKASVVQATKDMHALPLSQRNLLRSKFNSLQNSTNIAGSLYFVAFQLNCGVFSCTLYWQRWIVWYISDWTDVLGPAGGAFLGFMACNGYPACVTLLAGALLIFLHVVHDAAQQNACVSQKFLYWLPGWPTTNLDVDPKSYCI